MRLFVASDIHGSFYYCQKMVEAFENENCDNILLLGDILYHGPRNDLPKEYNPKKVIELLNTYKDKITCVRGNCDAEVDQMVLDFKIMDDFKVIENGNKSIFATHGHIYNISNLPYIAKNSILLHGHTHVPAIKRAENCIYMNPGSISIPKENSPNSYMVIEDNTYLWKSLEDSKTYLKYEDKK